MIDAQLDTIRWKALELATSIEEYQNGIDSGLAGLLTGDARDIVIFAETVILGRALQLNEAFLLGRMLQGYNLLRTKQALEKKRTSKNPVRDAYAMLVNNAMGRSASPVDYDLPQSTAIVYRSLDVLFDGDTHP